MVNNCRPVCPVNGRTVRRSAVKSRLDMRSGDDNQGLQNGYINNSAEIEDHKEEDEDEEF